MAKSKKTDTLKIERNKISFKDLIQNDLKSLNEMIDSLNKDIAEIKKSTVQGEVHNYKAFTLKRREKARIMTAINFIKREDK